MRSPCSLSLRAIKSRCGWQCRGLVAVTPRAQVRASTLTLVRPVLISKLGRREREPLAVDSAVSPAGDPKLYDRVDARIGLRALTDRAEDQPQQNAPNRLRMTDRSLWSEVLLTQPVSASALRSSNQCLRGRRLTVFITMRLPGDNMPMAVAMAEAITSASKSRHRPWCNAAASARPQGRTLDRLPNKRGSRPAVQALAGTVPVPLQV